MKLYKADYYEEWEAQKPAITKKCKAGIIRKCKAVHSADIPLWRLGGKVLRWAFFKLLRCAKE